MMMMMEMMMTMMILMMMMIANADGDDNDQMGLPTESAQVGRLIDWLRLPNLQLSNFCILIPAMHTVHNT